MKEAKAELYKNENEIHSNMKLSKSHANIKKKIKISN